MNWFVPYEQELELAFSEAESILSKLPEPFGKQACEYLDKFHALKENRSKNYICYLLPFWLQPHTGIDQKLCRQLTVANLFGMMYYHLIDACMDEPEMKTTRQLPLAEFIHMEFIRLYHDCFAGNPSFWTYYRKYATEWALAVSTEATSDFYNENPVRMGHKAAMVKLTVAGSMLASDREAEISILENAVDTVLVTLQLVDDWQDWEKDLAQGVYNSLVSVVRSQRNDSEGHAPTAEQVKEGIMTYDALGKLVELADRNHESLSAIKQLAPDLYHFHEDLQGNLTDGAKEVEAKRILLQGGGLGFWLAKNM